jgi:hypothetical protein
MPPEQLHCAPKPLPAVQSAPCPRNTLYQRTLSLYVAVVVLFSVVCLTNCCYLEHKLRFVISTVAKQSELATGTHQCSGQYGAVLH